MKAIMVTDQAAETAAPRAGRPIAAGTPGLFAGRAKRTLAGVTPSMTSATEGESHDN
jgi:hypothetical protein